MKEVHKLEGVKRKTVHFVIKEIFIIKQNEKFGK
jgi:hypothetical protein